MVSWRAFPNMNVDLENLNNSETLLRIEIPAERVEAEWKNVVGLFARQAKLPGFRPGKAPRSVVESKYAEQIKEELNERLTSMAIREAIKEKNLRVLGVRSVEDNEVGADRVFRCKVTCVVEPEFALPDYKQITVSVAEAAVTEADLEDAMQNLRTPHASFNPIEGRGLAEGDFAVITYSATLDGQPLKDIVPEAPPLVLGRNGFWVEIKGDSFLPGFLPALRGMQIGDTRNISVSLPDTYPMEALKNKSLDYSVTLEAINERVLPELSDELAGQILPGKTLAELRDFVSERLQENAKHKHAAEKQAMVLKALMDACEFTPPEAMVAQETGHTLQEIIHDNQSRGVSDETLKENTENIVGAAKQTAAERVKVRFILARIAEQEKMTVTEAEMLRAIAEMSQRLDMPPKKLVKDLQKRDAIPGIRQDILIKKALDFVCQQATVTTITPAAA